MKVLNKVKKMLIGIGAFFISIHSKVLAEVDLSTKELSPMYGVERPETEQQSNELWNGYGLLGVLLILLVGLIVYFKKSKSSVKKKVLIAILAIAIAILVYFLIKS